MTQKEQKEFDAGVEYLKEEMDSYEEFEKDIADIKPGKWVLSAGDIHKIFPTKKEAIEYAIDMNCGNKYKSHRYCAGCYEIYIMDNDGYTYSEDNEFYTSYCVELVTTQNTDGFKWSILCAYLPSYYWDTQYYQDARAE